MKGVVCSFKQKIQAANNCGGGHRHGPCSSQSCWNEVYRKQKQLKKTFKMHMQTLTSLEIRRRSDFTWEPAEAFCQTVTVYELNSFIQSRSSIYKMLVKGYKMLVRSLMIMKLLKMIS